MPGWRPTGARFWAVTWRSAPAPSRRHRRCAQWLAGRGARVSEVIQLRSLLVAPSGERQLVELRAIDRAWPLVGAPVLDPAQPIAAALGERNGVYGLVADPVVLARLGLHPGDTARLGTESFTVRAALVAAPDRVSTPILLGAPVMIDAAALPKTGLVVPGSIVSYALRVVLPDPSAASGVAVALQAAFPGEGWRIRGTNDAAPGVGRFIDQTSLFLTLVGLTSLLVGGIGVSNGVRAWLTARFRTIATLALPGRFGWPDLRGLPDPGDGPGDRRHRDRAGRRGRAAVAGDALAERHPAGSAGARRLSRPAGAGRRLWRADSPEFRVVAAGTGRANPGRGPVPRRDAAGTGPAGARRHRCKCRTCRGIGRADHCRLRGSAFCACGSAPPRWSRWGCSGWAGWRSCAPHAPAGSAAHRPGSASPTCTGPARRPR